MKVCIHIAPTNTIKLLKLQVCKQQQHSLRQQKLVIYVCAYNFSIPCPINTKLGTQE